MANETIRARIEVLLKGMDQVESLKNAVRQLQTTASPAAADLQKLKNAATQLGGAADRTENDLRRSINALKDVRAQLSLTDREYAKLTGTINKYQAQLDKATGAQQRGGRAAQLAQTVGAIGGGAIFGGPVGAIGGLVGAGVGIASGAGAVGGAFAGAAIGGAVGAFQQQIAGAANYASEIARLQIALKGVSTDQGEFNNSLKFISQSSGQFLTSLGDATRNYTKLQASVRGAGKGTEETQSVFKGLSAAIIATGGNTESLNAAFTAATQVFSKGKVSAEELRGQIGERLPGAFTIFAQAVGKTPQQLDKALQDGEVSLDDFVKFSEELFKRYGEASKAIGESPFAASIRFELAMKNMQLAAGQALLPIATYFTNLGTDALNGLTRVFEGTTNWQKAIGNTFDNVMKLIGGVSGLKQILVGLTQTLVVLGTTMAAVFAVQNIGTFVSAFKTVVTVTQTLVKVTRELLTLEKAMTALKAIQAGLQAVITAAGTNLKKNPRGVAGVVGAAGVGILAATQFKDDFEKAIDGVFSGISSKFNSLFKMPDLGGNFGGNNPPTPSGTEDPNLQAERERVNLARELNALEQQRIRSYYDQQRAGQDQLTQLTLQKDELYFITRLRLQEAIISKKNTESYQAAVTAIQQEYSAQRAQLEARRKEILETFVELEKSSKEVNDTLFSGFSQKTALESAYEKINDQISNAITRQDGLLKSLRDAGGLNPETASAREAIGNRRQALLDITPDQRRSMASREVVGGEVDSLRQQIIELQNSGRELTTLDRLKQKYLADWDKLDPELRKQLESMAAQRDALAMQIEAANQLRDAVINPLRQGFTQVFDALINGTESWGNSLRAIAASVLKDIAKQLFQIYVINQLISGISSLFPSPGGGTIPVAAVAAKGMVAANGIQPFAMGGIVDKPTLFKFAKGGAMRTGLMGEAGPEAIIPLKRGRDGKLGVSGGGGGGTTVNVSVDAKGTSVQGNSGQSEQLGRAVAQAVQQELIRQKRPGGLLAA
jgi:tape measure domain-containing protein